MNAPLSPELQLVAACCRPGAERAVDDAVVRLAAHPGLDGKALLATVARHRVAPQVLAALQKSSVELDSVTGAGLRDMASRAAMRSLLLAGESVALQTAFDQAGLHAIFLKGTALACLIHDDIGLKDSWDIDLLVPLAQVDPAITLLAGRGYVLHRPEGLSREAFTRFQTVSKECVLVHPARKVFVELHWKLVDNPHELAGLSLSRTQHVSVASGQLRTLADVELFAYLTVHGTRHSWSRLKWIADVAAFLRQKSEAEVRSLRDEAVAIGGGRGPDVALHLCSTLFGMPIPRLSLDLAGRYLVRGALSNLAWGEGRTEVSAHSRPWWMNRIGRHFTGGSRQAFLSELARNGRGDHDQVALDLPRGLTPLSYLLRLPRWLWRRVAPAGRRAS